MEDSISFVAFIFEVFLYNNCHPSQRNGLDHGLLQGAQQQNVPLESGSVPQTPASVFPAASWMVSGTLTTGLPVSLARMALYPQRTLLTVWTAQGKVLNMLKNKHLQTKRSCEYY